MTTHQKAAADALAEAVRTGVDMIKRKAPIEDRIEQTYVMKDKLAAYEVSTKEPEADLLEIAKKEYPRDKNLLVQLQRILEHTGRNEIKGPVSEVKIAASQEPELNPEIYGTPAEVDAYIKHDLEAQKRSEDAAKKPEAVTLERMLRKTTGCLGLLIGGAGRHGPAYKATYEEAKAILAARAKAKGAT